MGLVQIVKQPAFHGVEKILICQYTALLSDVYTLGELLNSTAALTMDRLICGLAGKLRGCQFPPFLVTEPRPPVKSLRA